MKRIGFLSFGHWSDSPYSLVRSASDALLQSIELAAAADELGADGAYFRVHHFARQLALASLLRIQCIAGPLPPLRDDRLDLVTLTAMARTFDQISKEDGGQFWPATEFVRWLRDELASSPGAVEHREAGRRRRELTEAA